MATAPLLIKLAGSSFAVLAACLLHNKARSRRAPLDRVCKEPKCVLPVFQDAFCKVHYRPPAESKVPRTESSGAFDDSTMSMPKLQRLLSDGQKRRNDLLEAQGPYYHRTVDLIKST